MASACFLLLLLSAPLMHDSLHIGKREPQLLFGTHHKTGTVLMMQASRCFEGHFRNVAVDPHWSGGGERSPVVIQTNDTKVVHMVRNVVNMFVSGYVYHKNFGEPWSLANNSAYDLLKGTPMEDFVRQNETYTNLLRRLSYKNGIDAELYRFTAHHGWEEITTGQNWCDAHPYLCLEVCLENFTVPRATYDGTWQNIFSFLNIAPPASTTVLQCLRQYDLSRNPPDENVSNHITAGTFSDEERRIIETRIEVAGRTHFQDRIRRLEAQRLRCGGRPPLSQLAVSIAGIDIDPWSIQEGYA